MHQQIISILERRIGKGKASGENFSLRCPFHKGGKESRPSFYVNLRNGVWQCFTCKVSGAFPKLLKMLGLPPNIIDAELKDIRDVLDKSKKLAERKESVKWRAKDLFLADPILPEMIIKPYEWMPSSLVEKGFNPQFLQWMDIGYDRSNNRITYPIRDIYGNLAGVSGGAVSVNQFPKYKVYQGSSVNRETKKQFPSDFGPEFDEMFPEYRIASHNYLWNFDQVYPRLFYGTDIQYLIIVEGFKACIWLLQHGWTNTIALMGSSMSDLQLNLINRLEATIILFLDNDSAGRSGTYSIAKRLMISQPGVFIAQYPADNQQPDDLSFEQLSAAIQGAETYPVWKRRIEYVYGRFENRRS